jgi:hypothetical protein
MKTKYFITHIRGKPERIYYYPELSDDGLKACVLTRFALKRMPFISSGNRTRDRTLYRQMFRDMGLTEDDFPPNCEIHHNVFGDFIEWIPIEIHKKIHHIGAIGIYNRK